MKHVAIVGGGFGGLQACKALKNKTEIEISLIDKRNYHLFQPLLYQIAMAGLSPAEIAMPLRSILSSHQNTEVVLGTVDNVLLKDRLINGSFGQVSYDYLILACGAQHSYFGHDDWEEYAPGLKTLEQATEIRRRVFLAYEEAEKEKKPQRQKRLLTFVIIGGGPTGVELAGALGEISRYTLTRDFRHIDPKQTEIILLEAAPNILPSFSYKLSQRAKYDLEDLGVSVRTSSKVLNVSKEGVSLENEHISAGTIIWAAGVQPSRLNQSLNAKTDSRGRVIVQKDLSLPYHPEVFVIGDQACALTDQDHCLPGLAPVAIQQGRHVARQILGDEKGHKRQAFRYRNRGQMATIGRSRAVVQTPYFEFSGYLAWLVWLFVHIYFLIGFKSRFFVFLEWAWSYITYQRGARLIVNKEWRKNTFE